MKKKLHFSIFELVSYIVAGLFALWGLTYISLGVASEYAGVKSALREADVHLKETTGNMGFLYQGLLVLFIGIAISVIVLLVFAKKSDRDFEKSQRRAARLKKQPEVVEATVEEVEAK